MFANQSRFRNPLISCRLIHGSVFSPFTKAALWSQACNFYARRLLAAVWSSQTWRLKRRALLLLAITRWYLFRRNAALARATKQTVEDARACRCLCLYADSVYRAVWYPENEAKGNNIFKGKGNVKPLTVGFSQRHVLCPSWSHLNGIQARMSTSQIAGHRLLMR